MHCRPFGLHSPQYKQAMPPCCMRVHAIAGVTYRCLLCGILSNLKARLCSTRTHLKCCDGLCPILHQITKFINLPALVIKPKGCWPEDWLRGCAGLPIGQKPCLQGMVGHRGTQCWRGCLLVWCCRCSFGSGGLKAAWIKLDEC